MGYLYIVVFAWFLYLVPAIFLCRKVAQKTTAKMGWTFAFGLIGFPVVLLVVGGVIEAQGAAG
ncbi:MULTISPECIES: hypothetical protein [unclassified Streptomyces]|uniref:hypothetical protein n=1 Tax=unclassified Streptomyces TaxID=2593676 RepID=UPI0003728006|nr:MULTISPECIES: hypothetical protein [unclassified Streptomyces]MYT32782.1 hypothetical protein [Streptomyces sp. SID8354]